LAIERLDRALASGARTLIVVTDQGKGYLKALGNPEGPHVLACDLVGTRLATWLGLSTFEHSIIEVIPEYGLAFIEGTPVTPGPAFITKHDPGNTWGGTDHQLQQLINPEAISKLVIFDTWTLNCDRHSPDGLRSNRDNVYLSEEAPPGRFLLRAMDHTHCFTCGRALSPKLNQISHTKDARIYGLFPEFRRYVDRAVVRQAADRLGRFTASDAREMTQDIPTEWEVDQPTLKAWCEFLASRAGFLAHSIMDKLCPGE
jgi:hypothetical protein